MKLKILQIRESADERIDSPSVVADLMASEAMADRECFWVLHLNNANRIIEKELISIGSVDTSVVHPREVFKKAILNGARCIVSVHNHPGDQSVPSKEDLTIWERLSEAGKLLGIDVVDHLIVTPSGKYYSHKEENEISNDNMKD